MQQLLKTTGSQLEQVFGILLLVVSVGLPPNDGY